MKSGPGNSCGYLFHTFVPRFHFLWECAQTPANKHTPTCPSPTVLPFELSNVSTFGTQIWRSRGCWEVSHKLELIFQHLLPEGAVQEIKINEPCPRTALAFEIHFNWQDRSKHLEDSPVLLKFVSFKLNPVCIFWILYLLTLYLVCTHFDFDCFLDLS